MNKIRNIVVIKGASQYDVMRLVCDEFVQAFKDYSCSVSVMDLGVYSYSNSDIQSLSHYDMIFSIDAVGVDLYNSLNKKPFFWTFLVDPPFYLNERLKQITGNVMVSCVDRRHVEYIDKYYKNIPWTCFMPHGGIVGKPASVIPYDRRDYPVIMMGSFGDFSSINTIINSIKSDYDPIVSSVIDRCMSETQIDLETALAETIDEYQMNFDNNMFREFLYILRSIDALRRHYKRLKLVRSLLEMNISVNIWGNGWNSLKKYDPNDLLIIHGSIEYTKANIIMGNSKIVVNDMPLFNDGSHERVFGAMQSGAIVATDRSIFLEECFQDKKNIIFYNSERIDILADSIRELLTDTKKAQSIINNSLMVSSLHTWKNRAADILEIANNIN